MKKIAILLLILAITLNFAAGNAAASEVVASETSVTGCHGIDANSTLLSTDKITDNVRAAFLYEAISQTVMYNINPDEPMFPASLVKILTALIAIEAGNTEEVVVASDSALSSVPYDAVSISLQVGEQMKLIDLLYAMVVGSANDAAAVIAEHICGNQDEFVSKMNSYAQELGCTGTNFVNVHGLHDDAQVTTARDVVRILDRALLNETFRELFTTKQHIIDATNMSEFRKVKSNNDLMESTSSLYYDARVIGGRSGVTQDGRRCMAAAAESNGMLLISVVMGTESVYQADGYSAISVGGYKETTALLDAGFNGYKVAQILYENQPIAQYAVEDGNCDLVVGTAAAVSSVLPSDASADSLSYHYTPNNLSVPISKGDKIATMEIWSGNLCVGEAELIALNSVGKANLSEVGNNASGSQGAAIVLYVILGIVLLAVLILFAIRLYNFIPVYLARKRSKRYRRSHRRSR